MLLRLQNGVGKKKGCVTNNPSMCILVANVFKKIKLDAFNDAGKLNFNSPFDNDHVLELLKPSDSTPINQKSFGRETSQNNGTEGGDEKNRGYFLSHTTQIKQPPICSWHEYSDKLWKETDVFCFPGK